jgi:hypothetical protein
MEREFSVYLIYLYQLGRKYVFNRKPNIDGDAADISDHHMTHHFYQKFH